MAVSTHQGKAGSWEMYVSALAPRPDEAGFWKNCTRRLQWPCFPQQVLVLSWFVFFLCFSVRKASRLIFSLLMQLFSSFLNLKLPMNLVKKKKKRQNERYFSKSDGQLSILLHLSHPSWPICGRRRRWGGQQVMGRRRGRRWGQRYQQGSLV